MVELRIDVYKLIKHNKYFSLCVLHLFVTVIHILHCNLMYIADVFIMFNDYNFVFILFSTLYFSVLFCYLLLFVMLSHGLLCLQINDFILLFKS